MNTAMILYRSVKASEIPGGLKDYLLHEKEFLPTDLASCISPHSNTQFCDKFNTQEKGRSKQVL
jgi:hypothetical protein